MKIFAERKLSKNTSHGKGAVWDILNTKNETLMWKKYLSVKIFACLRYHIVIRIRKIVVHIGKKKWISLNFSSKN